MCRAMEEMRAEVAAEAAAKAAAKAAAEAAENLKAAGVSEEIIKTTVACILNRTA